MAEYTIITDSSCDLPDNVAAELELKVVPLSLTMEGKQYLNTTDERGIPDQELYARLRAGAMAKTSAANAGSFVAVMEPELQAGRDVLYIGFSSALSATCSVGANVGRELMERYPERKVYTVDSLCASLGQGLFVYLLAQKKREGMELEALRDYAEDLKLHICHWFTVEDLQFLRRGGRVSAAAAVIGSILSIKPVMHVDNEGRLIPVSKVRGRKASLRAIADKVKETMLDRPDQTLFISHGDCEEDARLIAEMIKERTGLELNVLNYVGPVIGSHSGPGTIAVFFIGKER
ncbi:MAG TPA: DegV family protein [Candidatus Pullichristensenella stercorigallinarum]|uniref:DegV family protein n=1 Tax=Candidatus Pullichristensenella stercorigallinarum TaxID=2840909 RepID=A0A9D0ZMQ3_9FIRM|nr:DegV family protein [Candidatus Pullichristensenella stercorigallinarum]